MFFWKVHDSLWLAYMRKLFHAICMHALAMYIPIYIYVFISFYICVCVPGFVCFIVSYVRLHVCMYVCMPGCMSMQTCQWNCCIRRPGASQAHENVALEVRRSDEPPFATELSLRSLGK